MKSVVVELLHHGKSANPINATEAEMTEREIELGARQRYRERERWRERKNKREKQNEREF